MKLRTVFFGSSGYCLPVVKKLFQESDLIAVVTKPDKPAGRKGILKPSLVKEFALRNKVLCFTPENKEDLIDISAQIDNLKPDYCIVSDYGMIIPAECLEKAKNKYINIHFSKLPKYRGPSPVQYTILNGESSACITYQIMTEKVDTGDILRQVELKLNGTETTGELYPLLFEKAAGQLMEVLMDYEDRKIKPYPQNETRATYTKILSREDGYVPWESLKTAINGVTSHSEQPLGSRGIPIKSGSLHAPDYIGLGRDDMTPLPILIERMIRAFSPWPGVWTTIDIGYQILDINANKTRTRENKRLKILKAHVEGMDIGQWTMVNDQWTMDDDQMEVKNDAVGITRLVPEMVQLEGKSPVSWKQFLEGYPDVKV